MEILNGLIVRDEIAEKLKKEVRALSRVPTLAIVQVGNREDSNAYIAQKKHFAERIGAHVLHLSFENSITDEVLAEKILELNADADTDGIIVQMPLPKHLNEGRLLDVVDPTKDVDGLSSVSLKLLIENKQEGFVPATAKGILSLLSRYGISPQGKRVVVVGRSPSVGKPIALSMINGDATVTIAHSQTPNLFEVTRAADILVVAVGRKHFIGREHVRAGQIVVDVGINAEEEKGKPENELPKRKLFGDVDFEAVKDLVSYITPVPRGVGPMTVASLFENLIESAKRRQNS